jgi:uncharacterized membrane protein YraQ (UPF0718 family)
VENFLTDYEAAVKTSLGFFWKAGWAFVLGYFISACIQVFVPRDRLARHMGGGGPSDISLATAFGAISSSCSFAALAAARALLQKGAHFVATVAFMFASTNLVIELGILILIFLGWQFLVAEIVGGLVLIAVSSLLIRATYPKDWIDKARDQASEAGSDEGEKFDWRKRIRSPEGWAMVGRRFVMEWQMVWQEILIGFTLAGVIAVFVPDEFWRALFLAELAAANPDSFLIVLENAAVAPFVAAATFIGSMGNIPLATVLSSGGVMFAGIMGFIYSDLMVPPLVKINAKYYGWRVALYIAVVMYLSILVTAITLHYAFLLAGITPEAPRQVAEIVHFKVDYTLYMNVAAIAGVAGLLRLAGQGAEEESRGEGRSWSLQDVITTIFIVWLIGGLVVSLL